MTSNDLIGKVAARLLRTYIPQDVDGSTARMLLDSLSAEQTAAIAKAVFAEPSLAAQIELRLPRQFVGHLDLPEECLTDRRATYYRNSHCEKRLLLAATRGDDERQSLADMTPIDSTMIRKETDLWIDVASQGLPIPESHQKWWKVAIVALQEVSSISLDWFAEYLITTRNKILEEGKPLTEALGEALPSIHCPRNPSLFRSINERHLTHVDKWKRLYSHALKKQACYLRKKDPKDDILTSDQITTAFDKVRDQIDPNLHPRIEAFIAAPPKWCPEAEALAACEWEVISPIFDGLRKEAFNLGRETIKFFDEIKPDFVLTEDEEGYLDTLAKRARVTVPLDDDFAFYNDHRNELKENATLKSRWDKLIFGTPIQEEDFLLGIGLCLESLFDQDLHGRGANRKLVVSTEKRSKRDLRNINADAGHYFCCRYRGLKDLFPADTFDIGSLFEFDALVKDWSQDKKFKLNRKGNARANEIKFYVSLYIDGLEFAQRQLIWRFNPDSIACGLYPDWVDRLSAHPFLSGTTERKTVATRGGVHEISLRDVASLGARGGQDKGSLLAAYKKKDDIAIEWRANLKEATSLGTVTPEIAATLSQAFETFAEAYTAAVQGFPKYGVSEPSLVTQYDRFGELLDQVRLLAKGDRGRDLLLRPLLKIGVISIAGGSIAAVVAPWHPIRMRALVVKDKRIADLAKHLLRTEHVLFGDSKLFFKEMRDAQAHPHYPEVIVSWREKKPEVLALTDPLLDYSLHELSIVDDSQGADTNENSTESANNVVDMIRRYLDLFPHEKANLSAVLYNCDSAGLPHAVVTKIHALHDDDIDSRCEVVLRHRDKQRLHSLYERIVELADSDADAFVASEASRDFMARLRIGIMADEAPVPDPKDGPQTDLVFLHDVISRHAKLEWILEDAKPVDIETLTPSHWSRRRPLPADDEKSIVYLCCPVQTQVGWSFMNAVSSFFRNDLDEGSERRYLPARQLDFNEPETAAIFEESHNLGNWVVNYDEMLDRRQLLNQHVKIIRYKQSATQGRNLLVSSKAPLGLLHSMLYNRIKDLTPTIGDDDARSLAKKFVEDANEISGDIVLRAARRGRNASELMGIVLSSYLVKDEIGGDKRIGWYFLDDYSEWLGQDAERIADLLVLSPEVLPDGSLRLSVVVTESKYVVEDILNEQRLKSQKQLHDTIRRIADALFGSPERLDRDIWLSRFSDLLLNGIAYGARDSIDLSAFRRAVREGRCDISLRGYSHIFVSGPSEATECSDYTIVANSDTSFQETYSRAKTRSLLEAYATNSSPRAIRVSVVGQENMTGASYQPIPQAPPQPATPSSTTSPAAATPATAETPSVTPVVADTPTTPESVTETASAEPAIVIPAGPWTYPIVSEMLFARSAEAAISQADTDWLTATVTKTKVALQSFQFGSKLLESKLTPNAALLKFQGATNLSVDQVLKKQTQFLTTHGVDIVSVRPGSNVVTIAVARPNRQILHTLDVWRRWTPDCTNGNVELLVGVGEDDGELLFISPKDHAPHTLIAGTTNSGKSVLMQNLILSIACTNTPEQAKIVIIDPKHGPDYFAFDGLPHLDGGIIDEQSVAIAKLNDLVNEMERRYGVLRVNRAKDIYRLNADPNATERLPFIWVIHDEFPEWMMTDDYRDNAANIVSRLGVKARAAGIFLIFGAQRPSADVMPMQLRSNLGNHLILKVDSEGTSEIALGERNGGAEKLLGRGHIVVKRGNVASLVYGQVPLIDDEEIEAVVAGIRFQITP